MEQSERDGVSRSQNIVYTLPRTVEALTQVINSPIERLDPTEGSVQLMILTPDAETALAVSDVVYRMTGPQGVQVVPVTSANRAARLIEGQPVHAVAGTPVELQTLVQRSTLKLDSIKTIVLAWADDIAGTGVDAGSADALAGADALAAMEALFAELPKEAERVLIARRMTPELEQLAERYLWRARRIDQANSLEGNTANARDESEETMETPMQYVTVSNSTRTVALQRLLDEIDPPSAVVLIRTAESESTATRAIQQLGYRESNKLVTVSKEEVPPGIHTVIFFDAPMGHAELARTGSAGAVNVIALVTPREIEHVRELAGMITPLTLRGPGANARNRDRMLRDELSAVLTHGIASRELLALESLLEHHDGIEIAAAAVRLLERERQKAQTLVESAKNAAPRSDRGDRPDRGAPRKFDRGDRGDKPFGGGERKFDRGGDRGDKPFSGGERKFDRGGDRGDRPFSGGERKFDRGDRGDKPFGGDRGDRGERPSGGGERKFGGDRKFSGGDRKFSGGERKFGGGERKFGSGERKFGGGGDRKFGGGERKFGGGGERKFGGGERKFGGGERKFGGGERKFDGGGDRRPSRDSGSFDRPRSNEDQE